MTAAATTTTPLQDTVSVSHVSVSQPHPQSMSTFSLFTSGDFISQFVMLLLVALSIWSWAIFFKKVMRFRDLRNKFKKFEQIFWSGQLLEQLYDRLKRTLDDPLSAIFIAAMNEYKRNDTSKRITLDPVIKIGQKDRVLQAMNLIKNRESEELESYLSVLAMISSCGTFIGLFGTVCGIIHSFESIAMSKNTSLAVVAPGIAEALLATAVGLAAAIPALAAYNYLVTEVNYLSNRMDDFVAELYTILSRNIDEEKL